MRIPPCESKYLAGSATAKTDRTRGMSLAAMSRVVQPADNREWAAGYRDRLQSYMVDAERRGEVVR